MHCLSDGTHANTSVLLLCHAEQLEVTFLKLILTYDPCSVSRQVMSKTLMREDKRLGIVGFA